MPLAGVGYPFSDLVSPQASGYAPTPLVSVALGRLAARSRARFGEERVEPLRASLVQAPGRVLGDLPRAHRPVRSRPRPLVHSRGPRAGGRVAPIPSLLRRLQMGTMAVPSPIWRASSASSRRIFVPRGTADARIRAIESEGASRTVVDGDYDAVIARSAEEMSERCLVIDDTSWPGYEEIPRWVIQGYGTIFREIEEQIDSPPTCRVRTHRGRRSRRRRRRFLQANEWRFIVGVEPMSAACVLASIEARKLVTVPGPQDSIMAGLNCGHAVLDCFSHAPRGARRVRRDRRLLCRRGDAHARALRDRFGRDRSRGPRRARSHAFALPDRGDSRDSASTGTRPCLLLVTEGATDPESYRRIVG